MIAENYSQVNEILRRILNSKSSRRGEILKNADVSPEVRAEVESLLALEDNIADFLSLSITDFSKDIVETSKETSEFLAGSKIGDYEIIRELGGGGMGAVYLARRTDGKFEQTVAVKMLKREFNNEKIRRHFEREKEIQAKLNHANIARLLDAGTTADGVPFLVMEFIEGVPVDKFCAAKNLSLKERLKLFNKICEAVAVAHRNLIVHRDLKPSNILIDESGEPKLLDFGISKILNAENVAENQTLTMLGAMTPEYASPEQIRGETMTTATDIYSLGVVLFKILTGAFPYDFKNKTNGELLSAVIENEPTAPSLIIADCGLRIAESETTETFSAENTTTSAAKQAGNQRKKTTQRKKTNPQSAIRNPQLKGDLDNIVLKALRKEPERRYKTVEEFAADIWRHLDGLPILARPATFSYRASKFFRRNRISVVAAVFVFISLIAGIAVALWQAKTAQAAQAQAENQFALAKNEEQKAKAEEEKSKKISRFMFKVFSYANPAWNAEGRKSGGQARVLDALDDLSDKIEPEFAGEKDIQAELHHQFSEVYSRVWSYNTEPARRAEMKEKFGFHICRALELRREFYGDWHELVAKDMYYGAGCIGKTERESAAVWNKAIEIFRGTNPNNINLPHLLVDYAHRLTMFNYTEVHDIYLQAANSPNETKYEIAERYYRESLPLFRRHYKPDNLPIFLTECDLSYVLAIQDKWTDFDEHFAVCKQGEATINEHFSTFEEKVSTPLDLVRKTLEEKGIVR